MERLVRCWQRRILRPDGDAIGPIWPGTILITSAYSDDAKAAVSLLRAFYTDSELSKLLVKTLSDGVELFGGTKIVVTSTTSRRPRDVLKRLKLARREDSDAPEWTKDDVVKAVYETLLNSDTHARAIADLAGWEWEEIVSMRESLEKESPSQVEIDRGFPTKG